ncbi:tRNA/rRNA methyltransferase, SpoU [Corchorus olitorius]|uniref:rRNA methyltransferase 1, mitochondrial n=1 Tax=Corchorus olitorius TaxID=93759 RepID=A0A1R3GJS8_9ROSI|nr:tRNA/rRNA methyltransferase, SpoU [Corchorus olitorius]
MAIAKTNTRCSWEESLDRLAKGNNGSSWEELPKRLEKVAVGRNEVSSRKESGESFYGKEGARSLGKESRHGKVGMVRDRRSSSHVRRDESDEEKGVTEEDEVVDDPRWDKIKTRYSGMVDVKREYEKPEFRRWNKQESWGKKTWKEASESTVPKMAGEGVYGVGPVLAALSAGRREFYTLYVQEGLDLSGNNKKKKDKKGFEKVLRIAEKMELSIREISKHDLNMVVDNRPHQGLVLDASPLEMVKIKELDPVSDEDKGCLWVALDEVTDPQNLGAIIRSAYFFGASGVVLCAKNSAPLSGVVSKASAGSLELMELRYCKNMMQFLVCSAENGWRVLGGSVSSKAVPLNEISSGLPTILVLGSEGTGLRPLVERSCTHLVRIPGNIPVDIAAKEGDDVEATEVDSGCSGEEFRSFLAVESLNVSVAAGVLLHHLIGSNHGISSPIDDKSTDMHH